MVRRILLVACACLMVAGIARAQATSIAATVCEIAEHPERFAGKMVRVEGTIIVNHVYEAVADPLRCRGKEAFLGDAADERKDAAKKKFERLVGAQFVPLQGGNACMYGSCPQYTVFAVMVGRVMYPVSELGGEGVRLELVQVLRVMPRENAFDAKKYRRP